MTPGTKASFAGSPVTVLDPREYPKLKVKKGEVIIRTEADRKKRVLVVRASDLRGPA